MPLSFKGKGNPSFLVTKDPATKQYTLWVRKDPTFGASTYALQSNHFTEAAAYQAAGGEDYDWVVSYMGNFSPSGEPIQEEEEEPTLQTDKEMLAEYNAEQAALLIKKDL